MKKQKAQTQEWLYKAIDALRPAFKDAGQPIPDHVRVTVGFPLGSRGGKIIGQCWMPDSVEDEVHSILVCPTLGDSVKILATLVHELCHAALPSGTAHGAAFGRLARAMGLTGKMTATVPTAELEERLNALIEKLGPVDHGAIQPGTRKIQSTRMLKIECDTCGWPLRTAGKWIAMYGGEYGSSLDCPCGGSIIIPAAA